jgi:hypothetical protein
VPTATMRKTQSAPPPQVDDLLPMISQARQSGDPLIKAHVKRISYKAARTLGSLPKRRKKIWTGWAGHTHFWRGRAAVLDGRVVEVMGILRGQALVTWSDPMWLEGIRRQVVPVEQLSVYRNPAAAWLGRMKLGCTERKSEAKATTARSNGCRPCGEGKKRGRPAKSAKPAPISPCLSGPVTGTPPAQDFARAVAFYSRSQPR